MNQDINFIKESNKIEGINRSPTSEEITEHKRFIRLEKVTIADLEQFVSIYQPTARLRNMAGLNVRVGSHLAPLGGLNIVSSLENILQDIETTHCYHTHVAYETLHPFTDGNGRSGRALWAWQMFQINNHYADRFLQWFYYQSLEKSRINIET